MEPNSKKSKLYFDTAAHPSHVTFDDGKYSQRNFPWSQYVEARWNYAEPEVIHVEIGDSVVVITGNNVEQLFTAIEEQVLVRVRALPQFLKIREREMDSFATAIRFVKRPANPHGAASPLNGSHGFQQGQLDFGG